MHNCVHHSPSSPPRILTGMSCGPGFLWAQKALRRCWQIVYQTSPHKETHSTNFKMDPWGAPIIKQSDCLKFEKVFGLQQQLCTLKRNRRSSRLQEINPKSKKLPSSVSCRLSGLDVGEELAHFLKNLQGSQNSMSKCKYLILPSRNQSDYIFSSRTSYQDKPLFMPKTTKVCFEETCPLSRISTQTLSATHHHDIRVVLVLHDSHAVIL